MDTAPVMPAAEDHIPMSVLNTTGTGIRTMLICSCGSRPKTAPQRASTRHLAHQAHRKSLGLSRFQYSREVYGEGPAKGLTFDQWYEQTGGGIDGYTGQSR